MTITPSHRLCGLAAIMFAALLACARIPGGVGTPAYLIILAIAGIAYLLAIREFFSTPKFPLRVIVIGLALAALWHLPFLLMPAGADDDVHRYVWDGRLQRLGYNPYVVVPNDPAFSTLHTDETRNLNNPDVPSPYPAGAQLFFRGCNGNPRVRFCVQSCVRLVRIGDRSAVARRAASPRSGGALGAGVCLESSARYMRDSERSH